MLLTLFQNVYTTHDVPEWSGPVGDLAPANGLHALRTLLTPLVDPRVAFQVNSSLSTGGWPRVL